ncbi:unnamed protein product [Auanema sp. JU1783]|nr:unnamed protein product [Auanema sp. JU1783]
MSGRVRFSEERPGVAYLPTLPTQVPSTGLVSEIFSRPMPPLHVETNFEMDAFTAASIGDSKLIAVLIGKQPNLVSLKNRSSWSPLLYAAYLGHHPVCTILLDNNAQIDECNRRGQTALMLAAACGNKEVVKVLLERGASTDRADRFGRQALHYAANCSQNDVVDLLLAAGADPNATDEEAMTPVLEACISGHELTLISLLEKGGNVHLKNSRGEDGIALAAENSKVLRLIREKKKDRVESSTGGGFVVEPSAARDPNTLEELLERMNLGRYYPRLRQENLDLDLFFSLTEKDLDEMGVAYGPKKRMLSVIDRYRSSGKVIIESYENVPIRQPQQLAPSPHYATPAFSPVVTIPATKDEQAELKASLRYISDQNEQTKQFAIESLSHLHGGPGSERLRPLLTAIIDGMEKISTRLARHAL